MNKNPLVSILINNYNYGCFLGDAIDSAIHQTYPNIEVIVVDDGSTDNSREVIEAYADKIIPILKKNGGQASAFNAGFAASQGDIILLLDSDDIFSSEKVQEVVQVFERNSEVGWCFHPQTLIDTDKNVIFTENYDQSLSGEYDIRQQIKRGKLRKYLPSFGLPATSGICFHRSLLEKILPMPEVDTISLSDSYIKYLSLALAKGFVLAKPLSSQRIHENNAFTQRSDKRNIKARIDILTAYWMRVKYPFIVQFSDNTFSVGMAIYWKIGGVEEEYKQIMNSYLLMLNPLEKIKIYFKSFFYYIKM